MTEPSPAKDGWFSDSSHRDAASTNAFCADLIGILDTVDLPIVVVARDFTVARFNRPAASALSITEPTISAPASSRASNAANPSRWCPTQAKRIALAPEGVGDVADGFDDIADVRVAEAGM